METCLYKGKKINAYDVSNKNYALNYELKKEWKIAGANGKLICEECGKEVQLRVNDPRKKVPHFAHKLTDDRCPYSNNDLRESEEHKKGKMILYHYFKEKYQDINPIINYRFPNRRKADLYIEFKNGDKLAVEYQRTELDILEWQQRQEEYRKSNINVVWLLSGKEENIKIKEKQIEVSFFQQIMLNELDEVAVYLDVNNENLIFAKNIRYSDPYMKNNAFEELYTKSYNIYDVKIHTNGVIECDFIQAYKKAANKFIEYYSKKCLYEERERQKIKELEKRHKEREERAYVKVLNGEGNNEIKVEEGEQKEIKRYLDGKISYINKLKRAINGDEGSVKELVRYIMEWGCSDDPKIITLICKYIYINGNKKVKEVYEKIMAEAGFEIVSLEEDERGKQLECPFCKGKLIQRYGKYGPFVSCSSYPNCKFSFNI